MIEVRESLIPGVIQISHSTDTGPHLAIVVGVHGDENCGVVAMQRIEQDLKAGALKLQRGTLTIINANLEAQKQGVRHTQEGDDLNRLWDFSFTKRLCESAQGYEHARALQLQGVLDELELDALLDLHSASVETPAFAIINDFPNSLAIAKTLGTAFVVREWNGIGQKVLIGYLAARGVPAVVVECGKHEDLQSVTTAQQVAMRFLQSHGLVDGELTATPLQKVVCVVETITKPSEDFCFERPWKGFEEITANTLIGSDKVTEIRVHKPCYAVLPHAEVERGEDMLYLAIDDNSD